MSAGDRAVAGLIFLAGIALSATLEAVGRLAERLLGVSSDRIGSSGEAESATDGGRGRGSESGSGSENESGSADGGGERGRE